MTTKTKNEEPRDTAAGALIVEEAGGRVTDFEGNPFTPCLESVVATNSLIHEDMLAALKLEISDQWAE